ncbi:AraC family transcriptional regulator [Mesorhizobium sp. WSM4307]|uniref:AraC family transcriptional regulator n=1 Tax=unclassified Mesorhizobium TaxID=325217 RepID=UPI00115D3C54|nr:MULTISPECIES: AraC family transcriptional regulator [unclassified Mesorhizobium]TRC70953.1 AraC family transcriptional regulator [Mesorhizobium sp. WSM4315]TRC82529.1 AraC family transcriptional regulator [Mesorhizobium sp. WSM4307]
MDVLSDVLASIQLGSAVIGKATLRRPWGISVDPMRNTAIHLVQRGECWLRLADNDGPVRVAEGDVILVGSGVGHTLSDPANAQVSPIGAVLSATLDPDDRPGVDDGTTLLCAKYALDGAGPNPMVSLLPPLIHLTRAQIAANEPLRLATDLLRVEASGGLTGHDIVAPRLLDSVLVFLLRAWIESQPIGTAGWFGALRDKGVAQALRLIHEQPAVPWTVASLAQAASQSRATFARRFARLVGEPPLAYVTRWRVNLAAKALRDSNRTIDEIAHAVGYESAPSFSQAFARLTGQPPGGYRRGFRSSEPEIQRIASPNDPSPEKQNGRPKAADLALDSP